MTVLDLLTFVRPELAEVFLVNYAGEHYNGRAIVVVNHLPESIVRVDQRMLCDDELVLLREAWQESGIYVIATCLRKERQIELIKINSVGT